jgi:aspartate/methionine/tyrosine aminotransferase
VLSDWVHRQSSHYVLADEIYDWFMDPADPFTSWAEIHGLSQSILVHGYSKATGLAAYRIGYLVSESSLYRKLFPFHYSSSYGAAIYSQQLALQAQLDESDIHKLLKKSLSGRWELVHKRWQDTPWMTLRPKQSGMYAYFDIEAPLSAQKEFVDQLKNKVGVWVNPGWNFGVSEGGFRLNLCRDEKILERGLFIISQEAETYFSK